MPAIILPESPSNSMSSSPSPTEWSPTSKLAQKRLKNGQGISSILEDEDPSLKSVSPIPPLIKSKSKSSSPVPPLIGDEENNTGTLYWNASFLYHTGLTLSPKIKTQNLRSSVSLSDMHRPKSPAVPKYLGKSPSNDSGTSSGQAVGSSEEQMSPLRRRHLSCSSSSSGSLGSLKKGKKVTGSMRLMKALSGRPSLSSFIERTQSLGRYSGKNVKSISPLANNLDETIGGEPSRIEHPSTSSSISSSTVRAFRDSFRAAKNLLPSSNKLRTDAKKAKTSSSTLSLTDDNKGSSSTINQSAYSNPNSPKATIRGLDENKSGKKHFKSFLSRSKSNLFQSSESIDDGNKTGTLDSTGIKDSAVSKSLQRISKKSKEKELKKEKKESEKEKKESEKEKKESEKEKNIASGSEKASPKKVSLVQSIKSKIRSRSKERKDKTMSSEAKHPAVKKSSSPEILKLDNEPRVRTPKTLRQRYSAPEKDREFNEMEVSKEALEVTQKGKLPEENVQIKAKNIKKKSQSSSTDMEEENDFTTNSSIKEGKSSNTTKPDEKEIKEKSQDPSSSFKKPVKSKKGSKDEKKNSNSSSTTTSIISPEMKLLDTKLDLDEDELKEKHAEVISTNDDIDLSTTSRDAIVIPVNNGQFQNNQIDITSVEATDASGGGGGTQVQDQTVINTSAKNANKNIQQQNLQEGSIEANSDEDEEPSCTESFRQLKPFNFGLEHIEGKRERLYKVLVVGELGAGKTSIIKRYVHQFFSQHYRATIGVDFALKVLRWDPDTVVRLQLWDIAGQERFGSMTRVYYKEAVGAFVVFDVTRGATLEAVPKWKADLDSKVALPDGRPIPTVLLANKSDQPKEGIAANREKMNDFCQQQGFSAWFETSAKDNINIDESANFLVSKILEMDRWSQEPLNQDPDKLDLSANGKLKPNSESNCAC